MTRIAPIVLAGLFLIAAIVLGGASSAGVYANMAIELAAAAVIAFAILSRAGHPGGTQRRLLLLLISVVGLAILQLIPLPAMVWTALPGRQIISRTLELAHISPGWRPVSIMPQATIGAGLVMLPVIAAALIGMRASRTAVKVLFSTITGLMIASVGVGLAQKLGGAASILYFYDVTNSDAAVGFFANANHFSTLCALSIPAVTALFLASKGATRPNMRWVFLGGLLVIPLLGIWAGKSEAGAGLTLFAVASIYPIARLQRGSRKIQYAFIGVLISVVVVAAITLLVIGVDQAAGGVAPGGDMGRVGLWSRTITAIMATMPIGTGLGTFTAVYPQFEDAMTVTYIYANHAHNDYLETLMTGGFPAFLLMIAFAVWWIRTSISIWRSPMRDAFAEAATVMTAIIMIHELVDYPLRTAAIAAIFGLCCGVMARPRRIVEQRNPSERVGRHIAA